MGSKRGHGPALSVLGMLTVMVAGGAHAQDSVSGPLVVSSAGSLAPALKELLGRFTREHPAVQPRQESGGSVEAVRRARDPARVPDVLGVADYALIPLFLVPVHATWYATIAGNAMVLACSPRSPLLRDIDAHNWPDMLLRAGVRTWRADPSLDPGAYRVVLIYRLAERFYHHPGLAASLERAAPIRSVQPGQDPYAQLEAGQVDCLWTYRSQTMSRHVPFVTMPPELDLGDSTFAGWYAGASVTIAREIGGPDSIEIRGEPIRYGLTIPVAAPHPATAVAFVQLVLSSTGRDVLRHYGFVVPERPEARGPGPLPSALSDLVRWVAGGESGIVPDTAAAHYVGRVVTIEGVVAKVKIAAHRHVAFLNFGADFPRQTLSAFVPDTVWQRFGDLTKWQGKRARVTGEVWLQDGRWPAVTVTDSARLVEVR
jgi:molybdate/tungstate transport system substrate-binding protein